MQPLAELNMGHYADVLSTFQNDLESALIQFSSKKQQKKASLANKRSSASGTSVVVRFWSCVLLESDPQIVECFVLVFKHVPGEAEWVIGRSGESGRCELNARKQQRTHRKTSEVTGFGEWAASKEWTRAQPR